MINERHAVLVNHSGSRVKFFSHLRKPAACFKVPGMADIETKNRTIALRPVDRARVEALTSCYLGDVAEHLRGTVRLSETDVLRLALVDACALRGVVVDAGEEAGA